MLTRLLIGLMMASVMACGGHTRAPVEDRGVMQAPHAIPVRQAVAGYYVQRGDTLYSIAFRYGLDFRKVAAANGIPAPYRIYPGQLIRLQEAPVPAPSAASTTSTAPSSPAVTANAPAPAKAPQPKAPPPVSRSAASAAAPSASTGVYTGGKVSSWRWPTPGRVIRRYTEGVHKGIDIAGARGDAVIATAPGKVVYAGNGIVGFGELLIIKHNDVYLSAYGHNDRLLVVEGQVVAAGEQVAEKGSSGTDVVKLHFEIRKEGKPIDPQRLLPRR